MSEKNPVEGHLTFGDFEQLKGITPWLAEMGIKHLFFDVDATLTAVYDHGNIPHSVRDTVDHLGNAGFGLHIATNNEVNLDPLASFLGIDNVVQPDYEIYKISEKYWENLIRVTGINPKNCLMIGDNPSDDCTVPASFGFYTALVGRYDPNDFFA